MFLHLLHYLMREEYRNLQRTHIFILYTQLQKIFYFFPFKTAVYLFIFICLFIFITKRALRQNNARFNLRI
jgi:hypothetical protein